METVIQNKEIKDVFVLIQGVDENRGKEVGYEKDGYALMEVFIVKKADNKN